MSISRNDIQKIIDILTTINDKINPDTDVVWAGYDTWKMLKEDVESDISKLITGDYSILDRLPNLFAPTGVFQELSLSNGWGQEFIELAKLFDSVYERIQST